MIAEAGIGEETLVFEFDPAQVAAVRERGTMFTNRMWAQFRRGRADPAADVRRADRPGTWTPSTDRSRAGRPRRGCGSGAEAVDEADQRLEGASASIRTRTDAVVDQSVRG